MLLNRFAQTFYQVSLSDVDVVQVPRMGIADVFVVRLDRTTGAVVSEVPAPPLWRRAFRIHPTTGILTSFGRLDVDTYQVVILTLVAIDDLWEPLQFAYQNLSVTIAYSYVCVALWRVGVNGGRGRCGTTSQCTTPPPPPP
jgi:hypothetical protein